MEDNQQETGLVSIQSKRSVGETVQRLQEVLKARGVKIFEIVDHSGEAEKVGLRMPDTKLIIFGNPKGGTPLMLAAPTIAIDLPLKLLIREDGDAKVWITYNAAEFLRKRHDLPAELMQTLAVAGALAGEIAQ